MRFGKGYKLKWKDDYMNITYTILDWDYGGGADSEILWAWYGEGAFPGDGFGHHTIWSHNINEVDDLIFMGRIEIVGKPIEPVKSIGKFSLV